jgi:hypothetical protein
MKIVFNKFEKILVFLIFFLFSFANNSLAEYINIYQWDYLKLSVEDLIPYKDSKVIVLKKNNRPAIIDISSLLEKSIAGVFSKIKLGPNNNIWGLNKNKNLYYFSDPIWKRFKQNIKIEDFSISHNAVHSIKRGRIISYDLSGKQIIYNSLSKLKNIKQILFLDINMVLLLEENGNLKIFRGKKKPLKKYVKKIQKSIIQSFEWKRNYQTRKNRNDYKTKNIKKLSITNNVQVNYQFLKDIKFKKIQNNVSKILFANEKHAYVILKNKTIIFYDLTERKIKSIKNKNSIKIKSLVQNSYGNLLAIDKNKLYVSKINVEQIDTKENKKKYIEKKLTFRKLNIEASKIFYGPDGTFIINKLGLLQLINSNRKFITIPGRLKNITNPGNGEIWGINYLGRIFYFKNKKWIQMRGLAKFISSKGAKVLIVDENNLVREFNWKNKTFTNLKIKAEKVFLQDSLNFWILRDNRIYSCKKRTCKRKDGRYKKISISPEGIVFALNIGNQLERYNGKNFKKVKTSTKDIIDFIAIKNAEVILINKDYNLLTSNKNNILKENKKNVKYFLTNKYDENATVGKGFSILRGKKTTSSQMSNSVAHSSQGFKYKSRFQVEKIINQHYFYDFNMGRDNRLWGVTPYNSIMQYHVKSKEFINYTSSNFQSVDQKYLGVPPVGVQRIISDKHERIWAIQDGSQTIYYQEQKKGLFKFTTIPSAHDSIRDITVDDHGNVYVAAGDIFKWNYNKKKFEKFISNNHYTKISSGLPGTLWAINEDRNIYEYLNGKMNKRYKVGGKIEGQDIDVSVSGIIYATSRSHDHLEDIPEGFGTYSPEGHEGNHIRCRLYKYNPIRKLFEQVWTTGSQYAQRVAVAEDGAPWTSRSSCQNNHIYKPK